MVRVWRAAAVALSVLASSASATNAEEGMWTFEAFPVERMRAAFGWAPDQAWLDRVMAGSAHLPGCSAANVSARGLVLTNHHCVIACVNALSTADANYLEQGFGAHTRSEERRCPNLSLRVLTDVADVTGRIDTATTGTAPEAFADARDAEIARIEGECSGGARRCEVVTLYQGGRYSLYSYRWFDDVRLVFAPEHAMAAFGGDPDNFNFPRYSMDFAFLRLYENGAPARTPGHLELRFTPLEAGEIVLTAGTPGRTSRLSTVAELSFERDVNLPWQIASLAELRQRLAVYVALGPEQARLSASTLQSVENALKGLTGRRRALEAADNLARVREREEDLQTRVRRNRANQREVGDAWGEIARAQSAYRGFFYRYQYLEVRAGERSALFAWARDIVRGVEDRERPDGERLARYSDERLPFVRRSLGADRPVTPDLEALHLALWIEQARAHLSEADNRRLFGDESAETLAARLSQSRLADPAYRMALWEGGVEAVAASDDPMIVLARALDADARAMRARYVQDVEGPVARAQERIARARFRAFGEALYPDPTFSPRLSYGRVEGWREPGGQEVGAFTYVGGLYEHATGIAPFALSERWADARARLDGGAIFNVSTSNDVMGGNSGSPLLDREGRVVGVVFDSNIHALGGEYVYDGALNRSVSVASTAIEAALEDVYGMDALLSELRGR
jgi:hypothetical protein